MIRSFSCAHPVLTTPRRFWVSYLLLWVLLGWGGGRQALAQCQKLDLQAPHWQLVMAEEFDKPTLNEQLWFTTPGGLVKYAGRYPGWGSEYFPQPGHDDYDSRLLTITPDDPDSTVTGVLHLTAIPLAKPVNTGVNYSDTEKPRLARYKSAIIRAKSDFPPYGAFVMRARLPRAIDYHAWPTFWLWSCTTEIDILDGVGIEKKKRASYLANVIDNINLSITGPTADECLATPFAHPSLVDYTPGAKASSEFNKQDERLRRRPRRKTQFDLGYNTYAMVWTPQKVVFYFNDEAFFTVPRSEVRTFPKWNALMVSLQMFPGATMKKTYTMDVDYIRIYQTNLLEADGKTPRYEAVTCE